MRRRQFRRTVRTADTVQLEEEAVRRTVRNADTVQIEEEAVQVDGKNC